MSKYISKAEEISKRIQHILDSFEIKKGSNGWPDEYFAPEEVTKQYPDVLLDIQNLFFCDSPRLPLYLLALELNERRKSVMEHVGMSFKYVDFVQLKGLISKYIQYREFFEVAD